MSILPKALSDQYIAKQEELRTSNRIYCSNAKCSKWIKPALIVDKSAVCNECFLLTCTICKGEQHRGKCPQDVGMKQLIKVARQKHWKKCPNCKEMIELDRGCYHIT